MIARALGVDGEQVRALLGVWFRGDLRTERSGLRSSVMKLVLYFLLGLALTVPVVGSPDGFIGATVFLTAVALIVGLEVLVEFHRVVLAPEDAEVLGPQPVSSRTYFFARLAYVLAYVGAFVTALALPSVLAFALAWGIDLKRGLVAALAAYALGLFVVSVIASMYASLLRRIRPDRLRRVLGYAQILLLFAVYGLFLLPSWDLSPRPFGGGGNTEIPGWIYLNPAAWFASWIEWSRGNGGIRTTIMGGLALLLLPLILVLIRDRLSLAYAQQLATLLHAPSASPAKAELFEKSLWIGAFLRPEHRAVALLARAQFRYDHKFRLSVLAVLPMIAVFGLLALRLGGLQDPFVHGLADFDRSLLVYLALFLSLLPLQAQLRESDHHEAAWVFRATPCDPAEVILGMKTVLLLSFVLPLLLLLTGIFAVSFGDLWHAVLHSTMLFLLVHLVLQLGYLLAPADLPFSLPPRSGSSTASMLALALVILVLILAVIPLLVQYIYPRGWSLVLAFAVGGALSWGLERLLRRRLRWNVRSLVIPSAPRIHC